MIAMGSTCFALLVLCVPRQVGNGLGGYWIW